MRHNIALAVNTNTDDLVYELEVSPRSSLDSKVSSITDFKQHDTPTVSNVTPTPALTTTSTPTITPSIRLLFSLISKRHFFFLVLPAIFSSIVSGGIAPFMTFVIGQAFDAFARFPLTPNPSQDAKDALLRGVGLAALELVGLAVGSIALGSITSCLWIWTGEINVMALRKRVYTSVTGKDMVWFDSHMGSTDSTTQSTNEDNGPVGAGGLMAKFTRETDDVRMSTSLASGMLIQYLTTCLTCLILAFMRSWALTLVILSAVPLLMFIQALSQGFAGPLLAQDRQQTGVAATIIDRAITAISTVKAFNASTYEHDRASKSFHTLRRASQKLSAVWGLTSGLAQFVMMGMFVQGFWFGAKLVRDGKVSAGDVMAVFWACLIATSNLQMCIPQFITLAKGKFAMVSLLTLASDSTSSQTTPASPIRTRISTIFTSPTSTYTFPTRYSKDIRKLRKISPTRCHGEFALHNITFAYPSRPTVPVLSDVSLYLPANETTFIVGSSGSGKSTVAQLLMRMYEPQTGFVSLDEQDVRYLDENWIKGHVAGVSQNGVVILDGKSVWENVAAGILGKREQPATNAEVEEACRAALMHEFVRDLPNGYETLLGGGAGGVGLSGGQKQRLAIARARLRNPTVLILDEATSALDATSRILVFEAIKRWRQNKTTIVITHDLSQITDGDFVYVLKNGSVVEQGYRYDLEMTSPIDDDDDDDDDDDSGKGEFRKMMEAQRMTGGYLPEKDIDEDEEKNEQLMKDVLLLEDEQEDEKEVTLLHSHLKTQSISIRPLTLGNWMFDVVADLVAAPAPTAAPLIDRTPRALSRFAPFGEDDFSPVPERRRPSSTQIQSPTTPTSLHYLPSKRYSLQFTPTSMTFTNRMTMWGKEDDDVEDLDEDLFEKEKEALKRSGSTAKSGRGRKDTIRTRWDGEKVVPMVGVRIDTPTKKGSKSKQLSEKEKNDDSDSNNFERPAFWSLMRKVIPTVPRKPLLFLGLVICVCSGAMTPVFSFLLSRLLFEVSVGAHDVSTINRFGGIVLGIAAIDGTLLGLKYFIMETCGMAWITCVRNASLSKVLAQDKKWFDKSANSPARMVQILVKDGDDARNLISVVWGQCLVVMAMLGVGLVWALVRGWQLTLVGFAIAPVFGITMAVQTRLVAKCEIRNKRAREEVAKGYYEAITNIRGIRAMAFEGIYQTQFDNATAKALTTGVRGAFVEGCTYGIASGLIYLAEALLFYVGAVLIARGTYTYLQMVEVLNLVVFTVTIGSQLMAFTEKIAKSVQATCDLNQLMELDTNSTDESRGVLHPELAGPLHFSNVQFFYPERPEAPVLKNVNLTIEEGECVAIVGSSGSGKSTIAALLQRLYEPVSGTITVGYNQLHDMDVRHLRDNISVVSQHPNLFDASIAENIRYGNQAVSEVDIRTAAKAANVHEFIMSLPHGYDTMVGENASLISGGQAQRLQIARALARPSRVLILDECTSALDPENQAAVLDTIKKAKEGRTTVMVTHKLQVMLMCDRILVLDDGEVKEEGTYEHLMETKGIFATLANGGEWIGE